MTLREGVREEARALMAARLGLDFGAARRADLERGLQRIMAGSPLSPEAYLAQLAGLPDEAPEWTRLIPSLTVGETYFFRDPACFEALEQHILPALIARRRTEGVRRLRLWSAACATGEEAYSLAILLDRLLPDRADWSLTILGTDLDLEALATAERGVFREWSFRGVPRPVVDRHFHPRGPGLFEVEPRLRRMVTFAPLNLARDEYPSLATNTTAMDVVLCRNALMYFTLDAQRAVAARLQRALAEGGWLAVSPAEASARMFQSLTFTPIGTATFSRKVSQTSTSPEPPAWRGDRAHAVPTHTASVLPSPPPNARREPQLPAPVGATSATVGADHTESLLEQARSLADRGLLEEAHQMCERVVSHDRLHPTAYTLLAMICLEQGALSAADAALRRALYLEPDLVIAQFLLGQLRLRAGQHASARRAMERVVSLVTHTPPDQELPRSDGITAGSLLQRTYLYLEVLLQQPRTRPRGDAVSTHA